jgi:hypothetical protein
VPYNDRLHTKTLVNTLFKHHTSHINVCHADEEEEETPCGPAAPFFPLLDEDDGTQPDANLAAVQHIMDKLRNDIKSQLTELRDTISNGDISTVNSNTITRFNAVCDTALDVYKEQIRVQSVLQSIDRASCDRSSHVQHHPPPSKCYPL